MDVRGRQSCRPRVFQALISRHRPGSETLAVRFTKTEAA